MLKARILFSLFFIVSVLMLPGCNEELVTRAYDTIKAAEITYNAAHQILKDMDKMGMLSKERKKEIVKVASVYYESVHTAKKALITYKLAVDAEDGVEAAEVVLQKALEDILSNESVLLKYLEE